MFLRILAAMFDTLSQICLTLILILFSMGWTINHEKMPHKKIVSIIVGVVTLVQLIITYFGFKDHEDALKYHHY